VVFLVEVDSDILLDVRDCPRLCDNSPALKVYGGTEESLRPGFEGKKAESITPSRS
jgi:hypothetical protein